MAFSPSVAPNVVTPPRRHDGMFMQQNPLVDRRAVLLGAGALAFSQNSPAFAKNAPATKRNSDVSGDLQKLAFAELGWGDAEAKLLSKALTRSSAATKLDLNGNKIADAGVTALADSLRAGAAPKLKTIILGGNSGVSEEGARKLVAAREGLTVSFDKGEKTQADSSLTTPRPSNKWNAETLHKLAFVQADTLFFSELGWGDAEAVALSNELKSAGNLRKLFLNGNSIQCDGGQALATAIRSGGAPKLKILNLAGNRGLTEADRRALTSARPGITVNFVQLKQASDAEVYIRADQGKLTNKGVINRASTNTLVDGP